MKIAIISDIHANIFALNTCLKFINEQNCDYIYDLGDNIDFGSFPLETLERLISLPNIEFVMGDHDARFVNKMKNFAQKHEGEKEHYAWSHSQLSNDFRNIMTKWPYVIHKTIDNIKITFAHYGLNNEENNLRSVVFDPTEKDLDDFFSKYNSDIVFFGHSHIPLNKKGLSHYVNPGSVGVNTQSITNFTILEVENGNYIINQYSKPYDSTKFFQGFIDRNVPNRNNITQFFYHHHINK